jgi:hypothetical protein
MHPFLNTFQLPAPFHAKSGRLGSSAVQAQASGSPVYTTQEFRTSTRYFTPRFSTFFDRAIAEPQWEVAAQAETGLQHSLFLVSFGLRCHCYPFWMSSTGQFFVGFSNHIDRSIWESREMASKTVS